MAIICTAVSGRRAALTQLGRARQVLVRVSAQCCGVTLLWGGRTRRERRWKEAGVGEGGEERVISSMDGGCGPSFSPDCLR